MKTQKFLIAIFLFHNVCVCGQNAGLVIPCNHDMPTHKHKGLRPTASSIKTIRKTPAVVNANTASFLLEVITSGTPSTVEFELDGSNSKTKLLDNGISPDKTANDGIFSTLISKPSSGWNHTKVLGYLYMFENNVQQIKYNLFVEVKTADMPTLTINKINDNMQYTDYVFNIVDEVASKSTNNLDNITKEFYKYHGDNFDFLNIIMVPGYIDNRFHVTVRNTVKGIGLPTNINTGSSYGSPERLKGFNVAPQLSIFDGINNGFNHEIGHQWINFANTSFLKDGVPHMPASNLANGVMGISIGGTGGAGGSFNNNFSEESNSYRLSPQSAEAKEIFNDWELYMMGLLPASEVKSQAIVFKDQSKFPVGTVFPKSDFNTYSISDYIAQMGSREPNAAQSQKQFTMATIVISEKLLTEDEMTYLNHNLKRAESNVAATVRTGLVTSLAKPFRLATGDRATLRTLLNTNANCTSIPPKPAISSVHNFAFCEGSQAQLSVSLNSGDKAIWYYRGVPLETNTNTIQTKETNGGYTVSIRNSVGCNSPESNEINIKKANVPAKPLVRSSNGSELDPDQRTELSVTVVPEISYQWFKNNQAISGATQASFITKESGSYTVQANAGSGCSTVSEPMSIRIKGQILGLEEKNKDFVLYPNPAENYISFEYNSQSISEGNLTILDNTGRRVGSDKKINLKMGMNKIKMHLPNLSSGIYLVVFENEDKILYKKFVKK
ncbi:MAG: T9SS type A sorting domain-containing protein [Leadbetterella sp.]